MYPSSLIMMMSRFHQCVVRARAALKAAEIVAQLPIFEELRHSKAAILPRPLRRVPRIDEVVLDGCLNGIPEWDTRKLLKASIVLR